MEKTSSSAFLPVDAQFAAHAEINSQSSLAWDADARRYPCPDSSGESKVRLVDASSAVGLFETDGHGYGLRRFVCGGQQHEAQQTDRRQREIRFSPCCVPLPTFVYGGIIARGCSREVTGMKTKM